MFGIAGSSTFSKWVSAERLKSASIFEIAWLTHVRIF
jgi:hypothetical protein